MLRERVRTYLDEGENCARVILRAAAEEYGIALSADVLAVCGGINGGFGVGGMCSGIVAAVMALGLLFAEEDVKMKRILLLLRLQERFGCLDCCRLSVLGADCSGVLEEIADILQAVIEERE